MIYLEFDNQRKQVIFEDLEKKKSFFLSDVMNSLHMMKKYVLLCWGNRDWTVKLKSLPTPINMSWGRGKHDTDFGEDQYSIKAGYEL